MDSVVPDSESSDGSPINRTDMEDSFCSALCKQTPPRHRLLEASFKSTPGNLSVSFDCTVTPQLHNRRIGSSQTTPRSALPRRRLFATPDNRGDGDDMDMAALFEPGLWVACDGCDKWRWLASVCDPTKLGQWWYCHDNKDVRYNSCDVPQQEWTEDEPFFLLDYCVGSVVLARCESFPWWPAIIDLCPDNSVFFWEPEENGPVEYHVTFLDKDVSRCWVKADRVEKFSLDTLAKKPAHGHKKTINVAAANAELALTLTNEDRVERFGFAKKWEKGIAKNKKKATELTSFIETENTLTLNRPSKKDSAWKRAKEATSSSRATDDSTFRKMAAKSKKMLKAKHREAIAEKLARSRELSFHERSLSPAKPAATIKHKSADAADGFSKKSKKTQRDRSHDVERNHGVDETKTGRSKHRSAGKEIKKHSDKSKQHSDKNRISKNDDGLKARKNPIGHGLSLSTNELNFSSDDEVLVAKTPNPHKRKRIVIEDSSDEDGNKVLLKSRIDANDTAMDGVAQPTLVKTPASKGVSDDPLFAASLAASDAVLSVAKTTRPAGSTPRRPNLSPRRKDLFAIDDVSRTTPGKTAKPTLHPLTDSYMSELFNAVCDTPVTQKVTTQQLQSTAGEEDTTLVVELTDFDQTGETVHLSPSLKHDILAATDRLSQTRLDICMSNGNEADPKDDETRLDISVHSEDEYTCDVVEATVQSAVVAQVSGTRLDIGAEEGVDTLEDQSPDNSEVEEPGRVIVESLEQGSIELAAASVEAVVPTCDSVSNVTLRGETDHDNDDTFVIKTPVKAATPKKRQDMFKKSSPARKDAFSAVARKLDDRSITNTQRVRSFLRKLDGVAPEIVETIHKQDNDVSCAKVPVDSSASEYRGETSVIKEAGKLKPVSVLKQSQGSQQSAVLSSGLRKKGFSAPRRVPREDPSSALTAHPESAALTTEEVEKALKLSQKSAPSSQASRCGAAKGVNDKAQPLATLYSVLSDISNGSSRNNCVTGLDKEVFGSVLSSQEYINDVAAARSDAFDFNEELNKVFPGARKPLSQPVSQGSQSKQPIVVEEKCLNGTYTASQGGDGERASIAGSQTSSDAGSDLFEIEQ